MSSILYFTLEPLLQSSLAAWLVVLFVVGVAIWSNLWLGARSPLFLLINNTVLALAIVGATNLWAQGGMKARDIAVLAGVLALYDLVATALLPLMGKMFVRLASIPFAPVLSWGVADNQQLSIGLGDLMLMAAFALVMRKAFGISWDRGAVAKLGYPRRNACTPGGGQRSSNRTCHDHPGTAHGGPVRLLVPEAKSRKDYPAIPASRTVG